MPTNGGKNDFLSEILKDSNPQTTLSAGEPTSPAQAPAQVATPAVEIETVEAKPVPKAIDFGVQTAADRRFFRDRLAEEEAQKEADNVHETAHKVFMNNLRKNFADGKIPKKEPVDDQISIDTPPPSATPTEVVSDPSADDNTKGVNEAGANEAIGAPENPVDRYEDVPILNSIVGGAGGGGETRILEQKPVVPEVVPVIEEKAEVPPEAPAIEVPVPTPKTEEPEEVDRDRYDDVMFNPDRIPAGGFRKMDPALPPEPVKPVVGGTNPSIEESSSDAQRQADLGLVPEAQKPRKGLKEFLGMLSRAPKNLVTNNFTAMAEAEAERGKNGDQIVETTEKV